MATQQENESLIEKLETNHRKLIEKFGNEIPIPDLDFLIKKEVFQKMLQPLLDIIIKNNSALPEPEVDPFIDHQFS